MKRNVHTYFNQTTAIKYELEAIDFGYLSNEFDVKDGLIGIDLISKTNPKLSIHIGQYDIKYDRDISELRMTIATQRVIAKECLLYNINDKHNTNWFKAYIPKTTKQLSNLIDEFKYRSFGDTTNEEIINFLKDNQ